MRRINPILLVGAVAVLAAACRDSVVAPTHNDDVISASASATSYAKNGRSKTSQILGTIRISPEGGRYHVGDFDIEFSPNAVCDPSITVYGRGHWDDDCVAAGRTITVDVVAQSRGDRVSVEFQPDLRFRPNALVTIQTRAYADLLTSAAVRRLSRSSGYFNRFAILYMPTGGGKHIDEALEDGDLSMVTHVNLSTGVVWRRVKHFSGYLITSGFTCTPTLETPCTPDQPPDLGGTELKPIDGASSTSVLVTTLELSPSVVVDSTSAAADSTSAASNSTSAAADSSSVVP